MTPEQIETLKKMADGCDEAARFCEIQVNMLCSFHAVSNGEARDRRTEFYKSQAATLRAALALAEQARALEGWEVTRYSFGDFEVYGSPRGWTVLNKKKHLWLSAENIWTGIIGKSKFFKTPHEAAKAADRAEQR